MSMTIRGRLTIWFALAFSTALFVVMGVLAIELHAQLNGEILAALRMEESWITALVESEFRGALTASGLECDALLSDLHHELNERYGLKRQFALLSFQREPFGNDTAKILISGGVKNLEQIDVTDYLQRRAGKYLLRIGGHHYLMRVFRRDWGTAAVGEQNETMYKIMREAGKSLIWVVPLAILLAVTGGWFMAKLALLPVVAAAQTAESISLANLQERLPVYSGKDEFGVLVATLNRMIARLEEGVKRLQQFTQDAAHEMRTPLTILRGDLELAYQDENTAEETRASLQKNLDRVIALGRIVDNLMLLARSDSGDYPIHKTVFRLDVALKEVFEDVQILAEGRGLAAHLQHSEAVEFLGDELLIRRLLLNLCDNALQYTAHGRIELHLHKTDAEIALAIGDTGKGIPAEDLPHIFDRFYRVDKARCRGTGGSGLGLSICKWIAAAHDGDIAITSSYGRGTTVRVTFPVNTSVRPA